MAAVVEDRAIAAVIGAAVADAACQPLHWNYNAARFQDILKQHENPEFVPTSYNPFYCLKTGEQSCYGDQAYSVLKSLIKCKGLDEADLKIETYTMFGPNSRYDNAVVDRFTCKTKIEKEYPVKGPWKHFSIKHFLKNYEAGKSSTGSDTDIQIDGVTKIAPIVALYAGRPEMLEKVEEMVGVTQGDDIPIAFALLAARILEIMILHGSDVNLKEQIIKDLRDSSHSIANGMDQAMLRHVNKVVSMEATDHVRAAEILGKH